MHFWQDGTPCVRIDLVAREKSGPPVVANFSLIAFGGRKKPLGVGKILFKSKNFKKEINYNLLRLDLSSSEVIEHWVRDISDMELAAGQQDRDLEGQLRSVHVTRGRDLAFVSLLALFRYFLHFPFLLNLQMFL